MDPQLRRDVFQWDTKNWSKALRLWKPRLDANKPTNALAIGEREGGLSLWLALQGISVICTDLGDLPSATKEMHRRYGVADSVTYAEVDATAIKYEDNSFDIVIFKSVIGALRTKERQQQAINEMHRVLKPGGALLFAENLKASKMHSWLRRKFIGWQSYWRYLHLRQDLGLFDRFSDRKIASYGIFGTLGRTEPQREFLGTLDSIFSPLSHPTWRYIMYGVCIK